MTLTPEQKIQHFLQNDNHTALVKVFLRLIEKREIIPGHILAIYPLVSDFDLKSLMVHILSTYLLVEECKKQGKVAHSYLPHADNIEFNIFELQKTRNEIGYLTSKLSGLGLTALAVRSPEVPTYEFFTKVVPLVTSEAVIRGNMSYVDLAKKIEDKLDHNIGVPTICFTDFAQAESEFPKLIKRYAKWQDKQKTAGK